MAIFTPGELEVMRVLWNKGPRKPADIQGGFPRPIKNATLRSALRVLMEKGHVNRRKIGKAYYYEAKTPPERALKKMMRTMAEVFTSGSGAGLIAQMIQAEKLSEDDLKELRRVVRGKSRKGR